MVGTTNMDVQSTTSIKDRVTELETRLTALEGGGSLVDLLISKSVGHDATSGSVNMDFSEIDLTPYKTLKIDIYINGDSNDTQYIDLKIPTEPNSDGSSNKPSYRYTMETTINNTVNSFIKTGDSSVYGRIDLPLINFSGTGSYNVDVDPLMIQITIPLLPTNYRIGRDNNTPIYTYGMEFITHTIKNLDYSTKGQLTFNRGWTGEYLELYYATYYNEVNRTIGSHEVRVYGLKF